MTTITLPRVLLEQALEALEWHLERGAYGADIEGVTGNLRASLAQQAELERLRADNARLAREAHTWWTALAGATAEIEQWRRSAERCVTAWTVVRGGVWDPNWLMDEHMAALRKALGPNARAVAQPTAPQE